MNERDKITHLFVVTHNWSRNERPELMRLTVRLLKSGRYRRTEQAGDDAAGFRFATFFTVGQYAESREDAWKRYHDGQQDAIDNAHKTVALATKRLSIAERELKKFYE